MSDPAESCPGSLGEGGAYAPEQTFLPVRQCPVCQLYVEVHPIEPGVGEDAWRLELHDASGRTMGRDEDRVPDADCLMPDQCPQCESSALRRQPDGRDVAATCSDCGHSWRTGHLNAQPDA